MVSGMDAKVERVDNGIHPSLWILSVAAMSRAKLVKGADNRAVDAAGCLFQDG